MHRYGQLWANNEKPDESGNVLHHFTHRHFSMGHKSKQEPSPSFKDTEDSGPVVALKNSILLSQSFPNWVPW